MKSRIQLSDWIDWTDKWSRTFKNCESPLYAWNIQYCKNHTSIKNNFLKKKKRRSDLYDLRGKTRGKKAGLRIRLKLTFKMLNLRNCMRHWVKKISMEHWEVSNDSRYYRSHRIFFFHRKLLIKIISQFDVEFRQNSMNWKCCYRYSL